MISKNKYLFLYAFFLVLLNSCNATKYVPEGDLLYTGATVKVKDSLVSKKDRKALRNEMEELLRPKPNRTFLGLRPKLFFYNFN